MWNSLVDLSTWAESNSGQIQIFIGVLAFWLAYKGYRKVLEQIKISQDQNEITAIKESENLKISILNLIHQSLEEIGGQLKKIPVLIEKLEYIHQILLIRQDTDASILYDNIEMLKGQRLKAEGSRTDLLEILKKILDLSHDDISKDFISHLHTLHSVLIQATDAIIDYDLLIYNIEDLKKEKNID